jgi:Domain of unknown function (DUF4188)
MLRARPIDRCRTVSLCLSISKQAGRAHHRAAAEAACFWITQRPKIEASVASQPDGLLLHESVIYSLFPPHIGMRQYWRNFESLERWTRAEPHRLWWTQFLKDTGGTGFWHELYSVRGGFEFVYVGVQKPVGFLRFANAIPAKGGLFSARERLRRGGAAETPAP